MTSEPTSPFAGRLCRSAHSNATPSRAAITARIEVRNTGANPPIAMRVAGKEPLKMITPSRPLPHPFEVRSIRPPLACPRKTSARLSRGGCA